MCTVQLADPCWLSISNDLVPSFSIIIISVAEGSEPFIRLKHFAGIALRRQNLTLYENLTSKVDPALKE